MPLLSRYASSCSMSVASRTPGYGEMRLPSIVRYGYPYFRERDRCHDARPFAGPALDAEAAVEGRDTVLEPAEARTALGTRPADAVVGDLDHDGPRGAEHANRRRGRFCVFRDVRERLGGHVVDRDLDRHGQPLLDLDADVDRKRRPVGERLERRLEAAVGQDCRVQAACKLPKLLQGERQLL